MEQIVIGIYTSKIKIYKEYVVYLKNYQKIKKINIYVKCKYWIFQNNFHSINTIKCINHFKKYNIKNYVKKLKV
jgi:hypothetical protein